MVLPKTQESPFGAMRNFVPEESSMPKKVAALPKGYRTATASLIVRGADAALDFYSHVFGADMVKFRQQLISQ